MVRVPALVTYSTQMPAACKELNVLTVHHGGNGGLINKS